MRTGVSPSPLRRATLSYQVKVIGQVWVCSCPDFETRADQIEMCKHAFAVKFWIAARVELQEKPKPKVFAPDSIQCVRCGSIRVVKYGSDAGKQVFKCRDCGRKFRDGLVPKVKYSPETITLTLDLYFSGLSTRKIARMISDHFQTEIDQSTIYRWIDRFVPQVSAYVDSLTPQLSGTWHADEVFVKMKGGITTNSNNRNIAFLWNVMDRKTRFLLASRISKYRNETGGIPAFKEAAKNANGSMPETVFADGLSSYPESVLRGLGPDVKLVARAGIGKPHANNNRIERLNGTSRERIKVQRGWKSMKTQIAEGQRIHYNFARPHMALNGQTPAQAAGLTTKGWKELLARAITQSDENIPSSII